MAWLRVAPDLGEGLFVGAERGGGAVEGAGVGVEADVEGVEGEEEGDREEGEEGGAS